jgi:hypothetical protein
MIVAKCWRFLSGWLCGPVRSRILLPREAANFGTLDLSAFQTLLTDWARDGIDAALTGRPSGQIVIDVPTAKIILNAFLAAKPGDAVAETSPLWDSLRGVGNSFRGLSDVEHLVFSTIQYRSARSLSLIMRLWQRPRGWRGRGWIGLSPIETDAMSLFMANNVFRGPALQRHFLHALYHSLRSVVLIRPGTFPHEARAPVYLFWCVIALRLRGPETRQLKRTEGIAYQLIQTVAERAASEPGWAGFHEQWILMHSLIRAGTADETPLRRILSTLPIIAKGAAIRDCAGDVDLLAELFRLPTEFQGGEDADEDCSKEQKLTPKAVPPADWWETAPRYAAPLLAQYSMTYALETVSHHV